MISKELIAGICNDVGALFQMSCDDAPGTVMESELFKITAEKIRTEKPELNDSEIFSLIILNYSELIRSQ